MFLIIGIDQDQVVCKEQCNNRGEVLSKTLSLTCSPSAGGILATPPPPPTHKAQEDDNDDHEDD